MAKSREYMDYLDEAIEIAPANSQEEYQAAETVADMMRDHGLDPTISEFSSYPLGKLMPSLVSLLVFACLLVTGLTEGAAHMVSLVLGAAGAASLLLRQYLRDFFEAFGPSQQSQNVVAVHRAEGDRVVKGARPIVIVAHYDTPRENFMYRGFLGRYRAVLLRMATPATVVIAAALFVQALVILPIAVRTFMWVVGLIACLPLLLLAAAGFAERFSGCSEGANNNKAAVAAMLAVLDKVRPAEHDRAAGHADASPGAARRRRRSLGVEDRGNETASPRRVEVVEEVKGVRHGADVIAALGILPPSCEVVYEEPKVRMVEDDSVNQGTDETYEGDETQTYGIEGRHSGNTDLEDYDGEEYADEDYDGEEYDGEEYADVDYDTYEDEGVAGEEFDSDPSEDDEGLDEYVGEDAGDEDVDAGPDDEEDADMESASFDEYVGDDDFDDIDDELEDHDILDEAEVDQYDDEDFEDDGDYDDYDDYDEDDEDYDDYDEDDDYEDTDDEPGAAGVGSWIKARIGAFREYFSKEHEEDNEIEFERGADVSGEEPGSDFDEGIEDELEDNPGREDDGDGYDELPDDGDLDKGTAEDLDEDADEDVYDGEAIDGFDWLEEYEWEDDSEQEDAREIVEQLWREEETGISEDGSLEELSDGSETPQDASDESDAGIPADGQIDAPSVERGREAEEIEEIDDLAFDDELEAVEDECDSVVLEEADGTGDEPMPESENVGDHQVSGEYESAEDDAYQEDGEDDDEPYVDDESHDEELDEEFDEELDEEFDEELDEEFEYEWFDDLYDLEDDGEEPPYEEESAFEEGFEEEEDGFEYEQPARPSFSERLKGMFSRLRGRREQHEDEYEEYVEDGYGPYSEEDAAQDGSQAYLDDGYAHMPESDVDEEVQYVDVIQYVDEDGNVIDEVVEYVDGPHDGLDEEYEEEIIYVDEEGNEIDYHPEMQGRGYADVPTRDGGYDADSGMYDVAEGYDEDIYGDEDIHDYEDAELEAGEDEEEDALVVQENLTDPNLLHFDRDEDDDIVPRDTAGLDELADSYDMYDSGEIDRVAQREAPEPIEDPTWGISSYRPARPALNIARRAALFDLPDPSSRSIDPLAHEDDADAEIAYAYGDARYDGEYDGSHDDSYDDPYDGPVDRSPALGALSEEVPTKGEGDTRAPHGPRGGFWGGATVRADLRDDVDQPIVVDEADLQEAILEMGDEFLIAHDIWFVATGASEVNHAGIKAFLDEHRRDIRGAFLVNLEGIGAGELSVIAKEGLRAPRRADRRLVSMLSSIARDLHINLRTAGFDADETDAASAMRQRVRAVTVAGLDENGTPAYSHTPDDLPENVDPHQVDSVVRLICELIRRA